MLKVKRLHPKARLPERSHFSAGYDLFACFQGVSGSRALSPGETDRIPLGFAAEFPPNYVGLIWDRSSMAARGLHCFAGVVDSDYRGEWCVVIHNSSDQTYLIRHGDKIAQVIFQPFVPMSVVAFDKLSDTERGEGGFGSTGK